MAILQLCEVYMSRKDVLKKKTNDYTKNLQPFKKVSSRLLHISVTIFDSPVVYRGMSTSVTEISSTLNVLLQSSVYESSRVPDAVWFVILMKCFGVCVCVSATLGLCHLTLQLPWSCHLPCGRENKKKTAQ